MLKQFDTLLVAPVDIGRVEWSAVRSAAQAVADPRTVPTSSRGLTMEPDIVDVVLGRLRRVTWTRRCSVVGA